MPTCTIIIESETNCKITNLDLHTRKKLSNKFSYEIPGARYTPAVRLGRWDGKKSFFQLGGSTYVNLLPEIIPILDNDGYSIELDDRRDYNTNFAFDLVDENSYSHIKWPEGHVAAGKSVLLRDYQVDAINNFLREPQSIQNLATGAGKCLDGDTLLTIYLDDSSPLHDYFGSYLLDGNLLKITIGKLAQVIEHLRKTSLENCREVNVGHLQMNVSTPAGLTRVNHFIKKFALKTCAVTLSDGNSFVAAENHIVVDHNGNDVFVKELHVGSEITTISGLSTIVSITAAGTRDCYDIGIAAPHVYYDTAGILHHNTIMTAVLSHKCEPYGRTVVVVPNTDLVKQTEEDYRNMGLDVGVFYGSRKEYTKTHTICTWQSLNSMFKKTKNGEAQIPFCDFIEGVACVIIDECHGIKAAALTTLLTTVMARIPIRWAVTGTIPKEEADRRSLQVAVGNVVGTIKASDLQEKGVLANCHVHVKQLVDDREFKEYQSELKYLLGNVDRLTYISKMILDISATGNTLVLVDRLEAGKALAESLPGSVFLSGASKSSARKDQYDSIASSDESITICTFGIAAVGINVPRIFNLVLVEPGKSFVRVIQSIGRGLRKANDKTSVDIYDVTSTCKFAKRHLTTRKKYYVEAGYEYSIEKLKWQK